MAEVLTVPYLGTAEKEVTLVEWLIDEGESFRRGTPVLVLETLKASFEVEAEMDGVLLRKVCSEGRKLEVFAALAAIGKEGESLTDAELATLVKKHDRAMEKRRAELESASSPDLGSSGSGTSEAVDGDSANEIKAAPAARRRASELGLPLDEVDGTGPEGMIKLADVERVARKKEADGSLDHDGVLDPQFVEQLRENEASFAALSSEFKISLYRKHGARIGEAVVIGEGSLLIADRLVLGDQVRIGKNCRLEASDLEAGELCQFGDRGRYRARCMRLGHNAFFATDVEVGGGGAMDPEALLVVGSHGFVGEHVHLNVCRRLELGDEVVVSRNAVLMTHSFGASVLEGYPNRFADLRIGNSCQIGIACVLFPGVEMGDGSILLSGSSLVTSIPPGRMFAGVPAKDMKAAATELRSDQRWDLIQGLVREFARQLVLRGHGQRVDEKDGELRLGLALDGTHSLRVARKIPLEEGGLVVEDVRVGMDFEGEDWEQLPIELTVFDLGRTRVHGPMGPLASAFREFLRKRGVRLTPRTWTYRGGLLG